MLNKTKTLNENKPLKNQSRKGIDVMLRSAYAQFIYFIALFIHFENLKTKVTQKSPFPI